MLIVEYIMDILTTLSLPTG